MRFLIVFMQNTKNGRRKVGVLLFQHFSNHCLANAVEPLRAANGILGRAAYRWEYLTLDGRPVTSSSGLPVSPGGALAGAAGDVLFVMPSYGFRTLGTPACLRGLRAASRRFSRLVGMDAGSWLLAQAGLLEGRRATIHWQELEDFAEAFPEVRAVRSRVVAEGHRWSCAGAMTAFDLVLHMIALDHGEALRLEVAAFLMHGDTAAPPAVARARSQLVAAAVSVMREALEEPRPIAAIAAGLGVSQRLLESRFRKDLGLSPRQVYRRIRLAAARRYVEQTALSVAEIALRCGYGDPSAMTRAFRAEFGAPPRAFRAGARFPD